MKRRDFITLIVGAAAAWPATARGQQIKRIGVLMHTAASDATFQAYLKAFVQGLRRLGWADGENVRIEVRWSASDPTLSATYAADLVELLKPDLMLAVTTANLAAVQRATRSVPIVFAAVSDPVEQGFVPNLARPGGNITGFALPEFSIAGKWADLLKQLKPSIARVAVVFHPESSPQSVRFVSAAQAAAPALGVAVIAAPVRSTVDLGETFTSLSREPTAGLIFPANAFTRVHAKLIVEAAAKWRLPAIYAEDIFVAEGGLMAYQADFLEPFRLAPFYVDRILKGTPPGDLPVQLPQKFRFVVNRRTASTLGIDVPLGVLLAADEVIE